MSKKVTIDEMTDEIMEYMSNFIGVTEEACEKGVLETADDVVNALRRADPPELRKRIRGLLFVRISI